MSTYRKEGSVQLQVARNCFIVFKTTVKVETIVGAYKCTEPTSYMCDSEPKRKTIYYRCLVPKSILTRVIEPQVVIGIVPRIRP